MGGVGRSGTSSSSMEAGTYSPWWVLVLEGPLPHPSEGHRLPGQGELEEGPLYLSDFGSRPHLTLGKELRKDAVLSIASFGISKLLIIYQERSASSRLFPNSGEMAASASLEGLVKNSDAGGPAWPYGLSSSLWVMRQKP